MTPKSDSRTFFTSSPPFSQTYTYRIHASFLLVSSPSKTSTFSASYFPTFMGFFDHLQTGATAAIKSQPPIIRQEVTKTNTTRQRSNPQQPVARSARLAPPRGPLRPSLGSGRSTSLSSSSSTPQKPTTARRKKSTPLPALLKSSDDDSSGDDPDRRPLKKYKSSSVRQVRNPHRRLRAEPKSSGGANNTSSLVHAADIAASGALSRYVALSDNLPKDLTLQYPSKSLPERYCFTYRP